MHLHLSDAFIQSDLHCIQVTVFTFYQLLLSLGIEPMILALLAPCSTIWATGKHFQNDTLLLHVINSSWSERAQWNEQAELCLTSSRMRLDAVWLCLQTAPSAPMRTASGRSSVTGPLSPGARLRRTCAPRVCCCCRCSSSRSSPNTRWWSPSTSGSRTGRPASSQHRSRVPRATAPAQRSERWNSNLDKFGKVVEFLAAF